MINAIKYNDDCLWKVSDKLSKELDKARFCADISSKDPSSKVGARILTKDLCPVSEGYNGLVKGCDEEKITTVRPYKYNVTIHAEINAILFAKRDLKDCIMVVTHLPCVKCLSVCLQSGIRDFAFSEMSHVERWEKHEIKSWNEISNSIDFNMIRL